jgi:ATP-dependent protease ClpP protease subunit
MLYTIAIVAGSSIITAFLYYKLTNPSKSKKIPNVLNLIDDVDLSKSIMSQVIYADNSFLNNLNNIRDELKMIDTSKSPLKVIISTNGGALFHCHRLIKMLKQKDINYIVYIRKYAMSAGTLIALNAKEIVMLENDSFIGKIDPQVSISGNMLSVINVKKAYDKANKDKLSLSDLITYEIANSGTVEMNEILDDCNITPENRELIEKLLIYSDFPHEHKFDYEYCRDTLKLPVRTPREDELQYFH